MVVPSPSTAFFFSSRRRHTRLQGDWSSDVCSSDLCYSVNCNFWKDCCVQRIKFDMGELIAFVTTAEKASFRLAAEALFLSPPALSRRVERLESVLGARLLERQIGRAHVWTPVTLEYR